jgi:hypothetical protein
MLQGVLIVMTEGAEKCSVWCVLWFSYWCIVYTNFMGVTWMIKGIVIDKKFSDDEIKAIHEAYEAYDVSSMYPVITKPLEEVKIVSRIEVKNISLNSKGKVSETVVQVETLLHASRFINSFKPKRGYQHVSWDIKEIEVLI